MDKYRFGELTQDIKTNKHSTLNFLLSLGFLFVSISLLTLPYTLYTALQICFSHGTFACIMDIALT
ncbi:hypothetical protein GBAR_LOCUS20621, partial [Geodia barretti]